MPDSLILESPAHPFSTAAQPPSASMPAVPFSTSDLVARLYREAQAAADALEGSDEEPDGPLGERYGAATDRFVDAPVSTMGDVLLKLEHIAYHEDLEARPRLTINRTLRALLRDLRATDTAQRHLSTIEAPRQPRATASTVLDVLAIHRAADKEVDEIYRHQGRISGVLMVLDEISGRICGDSFSDERKLHVLLEMVKVAADGILDANDRLTNAIDPLNPTVLK